MKYVLLLLVLNVVQHYVYGTATVTEDKRQAGPNPSQLQACLQLYNSLSTKEQSCFPDVDNILSTDNGLLSLHDLAGICVSRFCMNVATRVLGTCKVCEYNYRLYK